MRRPVWKDGSVLWSDGAEDSPGEPALAVHVDNGGTLCIDQDGATIVLDDSLIRQLRDELSRRIKAKGAKP